MAEEYYDVQAIMNELKAKEEMDPDQHDGCYELMRNTIEAYGKLDDFSVLDYKDLNLVYLTTVGTWKQSIQGKKKTVAESHLLQDDKKYLTMLWDEIWDKAGKGEYTNHELDAAGNRSVGMFGTGFYTFQNKTTDKHVQEFIKMCVDILPMTDDSQMFDRASHILTASFKGMRAASSSMVLHCLKPYTFPVLNSNLGNRNIFEVLGVSLFKRDSIETYIDNCRKIKAFRDQNFSYKNYRIFDLAAWKKNEFIITQPMEIQEKEVTEISNSEGYWPSSEEYPVNLSKEDWKRFIQEVESPTHKGCMRVLACFVDIGGTASPKTLSDKYKGHPTVYKSSVLNTSKRALNYFEKFPCLDGDIQRYFSIAFFGRIDGNSGTYEYKMRPELLEALQEMDLSGIDLMYGLEKDTTEMSKTEFDHNLILYGPPGTGKTYNSIIYAVAICEGRSIDDVMKEPYPDILIRYRELQDSGRIAFTTFHQSYGYEEFIEGIKPRLNSESETLGYTIENGIFKDFCNRTKAVKVQATGGAKMKQNPRIWGMILGGTGMTDLKKQCFANNEIRLGWSEVDDEDVDGDFLGDEKVSRNAKHMVSDFKNTMELGDLVVIEKSNKSIDAIGVITGEYKYEKELGRYPRSRAVEWLVKDIDQDMVPFLPNGRKQLSRFSIFAFDYIGMDVISQILNENSYAPVVEVEQETKPFVFIIDEINRGNISKIFGELITLIEDTKRAGASEAMEATLPYSGEEFSVPKNVYILGTMNTADRSIALMDTALRRRFEFVEMMPNSEVLESLGVGTIAVEGEELNVARMLDVINERIEYLFDREHTIGHAFFTKLANDPSLESLANIFEKNVIPLLQEYFYEDYEKIQLILGDNAKEDEFKFVLDKPLKIKDIFSGNPDIDLPEKGYVIQREAFYKLESYKQIGKDL